MPPDVCHLEKQITKQVPYPFGTGSFCVNEDLRFRTAEIFYFSFFVNCDTISTSVRKEGIFMKLIDFHTHIYPDAVAQKASDSIAQYYGLRGSGMDGRVETLLTRGKQAGISHYVVLPVGLKPDHVRHINEFILRQTAEHSCFTGFGTVHAAMAEPEAEIEFIGESGLKGIKMHPDTQRFDIDDPRLFPVYDLLRQKGLMAMIHMGDAIYDYSHPRRLRRVLKEFPGLRVMAAHFGGYSMYETAREQLWDTDCFMDISSSLMFMEKETALRYIRMYGPERLVYGTDYPLWDPITEVRRFLSLGLTDDETEQIAYKTAASILGFD